MKDTTQTVSEKVPKIVLVGPTNVGKSTLFNRLSRTRKAIVCDRPGVTVDRHEFLVENSDIGPFFLVDTGGVGPEALRHPLGPEIERSAALAVRDADLILFVVDGTRELGLEELHIATWLRKNVRTGNERIWVVANKSDTKKFESSSYFGLGFEHLFDISAENDKGIYDLFEKMGSFLGTWKDKPLPAALIEKKKNPRILILGRPNVGKSTLINSILGEERHVVSDIAGTTRDPIESVYQHRGMEWSFFDTAGLRRPGRVERDVEWVAKEKLKEVARGADLAVLMLDSSEGVTDMDAAIGGLAHDFGLSLVIAFNKWDLVKGDTEGDTMDHLTRTHDLKLDFLSWTPKVRISALTGKGIPQLVKTIERVLQARQQRVQTGQLNRLFETKFKEHPHPAVANMHPKFYYLSQVGTAPPEFVLFTNVKGTDVHFSFKRFIVNSLRSEFGFEGTPIKLHFKNARR
jgi:GTP-binding protein